MTADATVWCINRSGIVVDMFTTKAAAETWLAHPPRDWVNRLEGLTVDEWTVGGQSSWMAQAEANAALGWPR